MDTLFEQLLLKIGEDPKREGLIKTPGRAAKAIEFLTNGYNLDIDEVINEAIFATNNDDMIIVRDIEFYSLCEHHVLPFFGRCHVGYIPQGKILGISKIARIIDVFSHRLQIQENLTQQIASTLMEKINASGVGVVLEARHFCMMMRGVEKQNSFMKSSCMLGTFRKDPATRAEYLRLL